MPKFDNERDRNTHGFDAGTIVDGVVTEYDGGYILVDNEGAAFDPQAVLSSLVGKKIRMTMISFESLENIEKLVKEANSKILDQN
jgi:hypothetical protein